MKAATLNGFSNWEMPFLAQIESIVDRTLNFPLASVDSPIFSLSLTAKTSTPDAGGPTTTGFQWDTSGGYNAGRSYATSDALYYVRKGF